MRVAERERKIRNRGKDKKKKIQDTDRKKIDR